MGGELKILDGVLASVEIVCCAVSFVGLVGFLWVCMCLYYGLRIFER